VIRFAEHTATFNCLFSLSFSLSSPNVMTAEFDELISVPGIKFFFVFYHGLMGVH
jgi:hypothetical protein